MQWIQSVTEEIDKLRHQSRYFRLRKVVKRWSILWQVSKCYTNQEKTVGEYMVREIAKTSIERA